MSKTKLLLALTLPLLFGCGGHSDSTPSTPTPTPYADPFLGRWSGTWQQRGTGGRGGTLTVEIARVPAFPEGGRLTGTVVDNRLGQGTATGAIWDEGAVLIQFDAPDGDINSPFYIRFRGGKELSIDSRGHLVGAVQQDLGDLLGDTDFDLSPVTP